MMQTDVLIIGAGPVGLIMSHLLGLAGVNTLQIESAAELSKEPRAVALDPESLRSFQSMGILDELRPDILFGVSGEYLNGAGEVLFELDNKQPGALGYQTLCSFNQPALVRTLASELSRYPCVSLLFEHCLLEFEQRSDGISARVARAGDEVTIQAKYMVACDGGRSTVRSQLGIKMLGESNPQPWLVIDTLEAEHDGKQRFRFYCDPKRPGMFLQTPHHNRRWEWMILPGEDRDRFLLDETIHELIAPYVDVNKVDIYRRRVYDFHAIIAEQFQQGRVFLAGDAAHMTPPFAGQGLNSGIRDAVNLAWKLNAVLKQQAPQRLLDSYEQERWQHAKELIDVALLLGAQIQPIDHEAATERDRMFAELNSHPESRENFSKGLEDGLLDRHFVEGAALNITEQYLSGRMISQPLVRDESGNTQRLDELLGNGFAIVGYNCDPQTELGDELTQRWKQWGVTFLGLNDQGGEQGVWLEPGSHLAEQFSQGSATMVLLRPDRFCMAAFDRSNANDALAKASEILGNA